MNSYKVTAPNGTVITRKTKNTYAYAVVFSWDTVNRGYGASFAGSFELAQKALVKEQKRMNSFGEFPNSDFKIVKVEVGA